MVSEEDITKAISLLRELKAKVSDVTDHVQNLLQRVKDGALSTAKGVSFLEVKYHLLLSYIMNLTYTMMRKAQGQSISGDPTIERLVEIRTVLEKIRPIDQKLKYQVDKLIKTATTGAVGTDDPLRFKPNPENMVSKMDEEESSSSEDEGKDEKSNVYRPPKIAAMRYDGDDTEKDRQAQAVEKAKKRALSGSIMQELRKEYYDGPEEIRESRDVHRIKADKEAAERQSYEEKYFIRMSLTKKQKHDAKRMATTGALNSLTHFGDISALTGEDGGESSGGPRKKRKVVKKGKGKKKGKKFKKY